MRTTLISTVTAAVAVGFGSSYHIIKRVEKCAWKEIQHNIRSGIVDSTPNEDTESSRPSESPPQQTVSSNKVAYFQRPNIDHILHDSIIRSRESNSAKSVIVGGPYNHGKTSSIRHALHEQKVPYIYLDLEADNASLVSLLEDTMNDQPWYRSLMRRLYRKNYHTHVLTRWVSNVRTLCAEIEHEQQTQTVDENKNENDETSSMDTSTLALTQQIDINQIPWIVIDGLDINDIASHAQLKEDIQFLHQQLCTEYGTTSMMVSVRSESPVETEHILATKMDGSIRRVWIGALENRQRAVAFIRHRLAEMTAAGNIEVQENEIQQMADFCRLNMDDINYCIHALQPSEENGGDDDSDAVHDASWMDLWTTIKQRRMDMYREQSPFADWNNVSFWRQFSNQLNDVRGAISKTLELTACKYLLYEYFSAVVVVGCTAKDIIQYFAGNMEVVNGLYCDGCFMQYGGAVTEPFALQDDMVMMPFSNPQMLAFQSMLKENPTIADLALLVSRHFVFSRELNRAQHDINRITEEMQIFDTAQNFIDGQRKNLDEDAQAVLELEILNKNKCFQTQLLEATRRFSFFSNAKTENIEKFNSIMNSNDAF